MTALFSKANFLETVSQKNKHKKRLLNEQFVFSVNKRGNIVLPFLLSGAYVAYVYLTYRGNTHFKK